MKLAQPEILREALAPAAAFEAGDDLMEGCCFEGITLPAEAELNRLELRGCVVSRCVWQEVSCHKTAFVDVVFEKCDFSGCDFRGAVFSRVRFAGCKLVGCDFQETVFRDVGFEDCRARYVNVAAAKAQRLLFSGCELQQAAFEQVKWQAAFDRCDLTGASFHFAPLKGMRLTTSRLEGISVGLEDLKGAVVNTFQAAALSRLLGLVISDEEASECC